MPFSHQRQLNLQRKCSPRLCPFHRHCSKYHPVFLKIGLFRPRHTKTAAAMLYLICSNEENKLEFTPDSSHPLVVYTLLAPSLASLLFEDFFERYVEKQMWWVQWSSLLHSLFQRREVRRCSTSYYFPLMILRNIFVQ